MNHAPQMDDLTMQERKSSLGRPVLRPWPGHLLFAVVPLFTAATAFRETPIKSLIVRALKGHGFSRAAKAL